MPANRRHTITATPSVLAALDELRAETGGEQPELGELVILGARVKLDQIRAEKDVGKMQRKRLAERIRARHLPVDCDAAEEVRRTGWAQP